MTDVTKVSELKKKSLGWKPSLPDRRDFLYSAPYSVLKALPVSVDLRSQLPPVYDQGEIGSCTANAIAAAIQFDRLKLTKRPAFTPSRLFIYWNERSMEGSIKSDAGASLRDGVKSVATLGVCPEDVGMKGTWKYDGTPFPGAAKHDEKKPSAGCYTVAAKYKIASYHSVVQSLSQMRGCLAEGYPFVFGIVCYNAIFDAPNGNVPMPAPQDAPVGGHAILCVGYDDSRQVFIFRNSWGDSWGDSGYGTLPYAYMLDSQLTSDLWTIRTTVA